MLRWIELKNKINPPTQKEILDRWNRDEEILPLCDMGYLNINIIS